MHSVCAALEIVNERINHCAKENKGVLLLTQDGGGVKLWLCLFVCYYSCSPNFMQAGFLDFLIAVIHILKNNNEV